MAIDYKNYHPHWLTVIRPRVLARAGNKCELCQAPNGARVERISKRGKKRMVKIILQVAHLDHNPQDWTVPDERLKALCQRCHLNHDREGTQGQRRESKRYGKNFRKNQITVPFSPLQEDTIALGVG